LTVVDIYTRESLAIEAGQGLKGEDVAMVLNRITMQRGAPKVLFCDNGSEFTSQAMELWLIGTEYESTSPDRASRRTMRSSNPSTEP
jgi:transposase InsO family protein